MNLTIRTATLDDIPALDVLIAESVRNLQQGDYSSEQIEGALGTVYGTDKQMIGDGTFFIVQDGERIVACGGWSQRKTAFGGDSSPVKDDSLLDPAREPAKIRSFYVHPAYARRGLGTLVLRMCETAAAAAGFTSFELTSTLTGVPLYRRHGYIEFQHLSLTLPNGLPYSAIRMRRNIVQAVSAE